MKCRFYLFISLFIFTIVRSSENHNNRQPAFAYYFNSFENQNATLDFVDFVNKNPNISGKLGVRPVTMSEMNKAPKKRFPEKAINQNTLNTFNDFDLQTANYLYWMSQKK